LIRCDGVFKTICESADNALASASALTNVNALAFFSALTFINALLSLPSYIGHAAPFFEMLEMEMKVTVKNIAVG